MPDEEIDFSDIPELDEEWFAKATWRTPLTKEPISIRLDQHVVDYFRAQGGGYQTRINDVLRTYVEVQRRKTRPAGKAVRALKESEAAEFKPRRKAAKRAAKKPSRKGGGPTRRR
jgi:uncharacterized protein (DUF4415 family)